MMSNRSISVSVMCRVAVLVAIEVVLNRFCSINTMGFKIGFSFVPIALCAALYGPLMAAGAYAMADFIGAMLFPFGPYAPGFTVSAALMGLVYGLCLYGRGGGKGAHTSGAAVRVLDTGKLRLMAFVVAAAVINCLIIGLGLNTLWVSILYSAKGDYGFWFLYRLPQYAILVPLNIIFLPIVHKFAEKLKAAGV